MPSFCTQCGAALEPADRFCRRCGHATGIASSETSVPASAPPARTRIFGPPPPGSATWIALAIMLGPVLVAMIYSYEHRGPFVIYLFAMLLGLVPASIAQSKGRNFAQWWVFGTYLWLIALIASLVIQPKAMVRRDEALRED